MSVLSLWCAQPRIPSLGLVLPSPRTTPSFRWLALWLDMCSLALLAVACFGSVALRRTLNPGMVGLSLSYLMQMTGLLQWLVRQVRSAASCCCSKGVLF